MVLASLLALAEPVLEIQEHKVALAVLVDTSASITDELDTHAGLIAREEEKLKYLDEAMTRLAVGNYGRCLKCGDSIPIARLLILPFASHCVNCQERCNPAKLGFRGFESAVTARFVMDAI